RLLQQLAEIDSADIIALQVVDLIQNRRRAAFGQKLGYARVRRKPCAPLQRQQEGSKPRFDLSFKRFLLAVDLVDVLEAIAGRSDSYLAKSGALAFIDLEVATRGNALDLCRIGVELNVAFGAKLHTAIVT